MTTTPLGIFSYISEGARDPSPEINDALFRAAALLTGPAQSATTTAPPSSPNDGDVFLIPTSPSASGLWSGQNGTVAVWSAADAGWTFLLPWRGRLWTVLDSGARAEWSGAAWATLSVSGIGSVSADSSPQLGGNLDGNNKTYKALRSLTTALADSGSSFAWDGSPALLFTGTASRTVVLPKASLQGAEFSASVDTATGVLVFQPETGATLDSGALGAQGLSGVKTAGRDKVIVFRVKTNASGTAARWAVYADHLAA
jgi:hypothetical protein